MIESLHSHRAHLRSVREMETFEVSKDVGNVKNNSPELLNNK